MISFLSDESDSGRVLSQSENRAMTKQDPKIKIKAQFMIYSGSMVQRSDLLCESTLLSEPDSGLVFSHATTMAMAKQPAKIK